MPRHPATGHGSWGSPSARSTTPSPCSATIVGSRFFRRCSDLTRVSFRDTRNTWRDLSRRYTASPRYWIPLRVSVESSLARAPPRAVARPSCSHAVQKPPGPPDNLALISVPSFWTRFASTMAACVMCPQNGRFLCEFVTYKLTLLWWITMYYFMVYNI